MHNDKLAVSVDGCLPADPRFGPAFDRNLPLVHGKVAEDPLDGFDNVTNGRTCNTVDVVDQALLKITHERICRVELQGKW